ncbi:hypothetical protein OXX59_008483 [Metschnikowia pulcherrima]
MSNSLSESSEACLENDSGTIANLHDPRRKRFSAPGLHSASIRNETHPEPQPQRSNTLSRKKPVGPNPFPEPPKISENSSQVNLAGKQSFWKFHIFRFGPNLYLTTNPTLRHLRCRNAPGYFVKITGNHVKYSMVFEDIGSGEQWVKVDKVSDSCAHHFTFQVKRKRCIRRGNVEVSINCERGSDAVAKSMETHQAGKTQSSEELGSSGRGRDKCSKRFYSQILRRAPIPQILLHMPPSSPMSNYSGLMVDGKAWNVGSLPRYRESRMNSHETKFIAKKHVYFHRCFEDLERYFDWTVSPVMGVFRECESRAKKRAIRQLNRLSRVGDFSAPQAQHSSETDLSPYTEVSSYYECGDGVYFDRMPSDDEPDHHHKLGWVTIYEDSDTLAEPGMFDLSVALTVAVGYERNLSYGAID